MTSLVEQLNRLKAPQTTKLLQDKKKPSLLFDPKEAAELDKRTVLNLGKQGLQELIELNKRFQKFEESLFSENSINFERSVRTPKENEKLNSMVSEFLVLVSPYFLINSTHKALEWLIHRFHIHEYNKDAFLMLILPYHESRMFIRALQLVNLTIPSDRWHWLSPLQKLGKPLGLLVLLKHLCSDKSLIKIISEHVIFATETYTTEANCLTTLYSFYTQSFIGMLAQTSVITEVHINHILPSLIAGLSSNIANFSAGSYMIFAQMIRRVKLIENDANVILLKIAKQTGLKTDAMLMIVFLYGNPFNRVETISNKLMTRLVQNSWLVDCLAKLKQLNAKTEAFMIIFLKKILKSLIEKDQSMETDNAKIAEEIETLQSVVNKIIDTIRLEPSEVKAVLSLALENDLANVERTKDFFVVMFSNLEKRYPDTFDDFLKQLMELAEDGISTESRNALRFLTTWHTGSRNAEDSLNIISKLYHSSPHQRIAGLLLLADTNFKINEGLRAQLVDALLARFDDDDPQVLNALLSIPVKMLKQLTSTELLDKLLVLISTCHTKQRKFLAGPALNILLNVARDEDDITIFLAALPFLFPSTEKEVQVTMQVLQSKYASNNPYMTAIKKDIEPSQTADHIRSVAFHHLMNRSLLPETNAILTCIEEMMSSDAAPHFFNMLVLGSICRVQVGCLQTEEARKSIELIAKMMNFSRIQPLPQMTQINSEKLIHALRMTEQGILPLQATTYVLEMVHRRVDINSDSKIDFIKSPERSQLILRLLEIYIKGLKKKTWRPHYEWCLKIFFQRHFMSAKDMLRFLSRFFAESVKISTSFHCLHITLKLLQKCNSVQWVFEDKIFVPHLLLSLSSKEEKCRIVAFQILTTLVRTFNLNADGYYPLLNELVQRQEEITLDADQLSLALYMLLSPDPDVSHQLKSGLSKKLCYSREKLFEMLQDEEIPINIVSHLLHLLMHVNSSNILKQLVPLGQSFLQSPENEYVKNALKHILLRFNNNTTDALQCEEVWTFFQSSMSNHEIQIVDDSEKGLTTPSIIVMKQIDDTFFSRLAKASPEISKKVLGKLVDIVTYCNFSNVVSVASRVVRRIRIDAQIVVEELQKMIDLKNNMKSKSRLSGKAKKTIYIPSCPEIVNSNEWKRGQTLLEFIQDANNIDNEHLLVPISLDLLKLCLSFEEQNPVEYTNQLILSTLHHLATKNVKELMTEAHLHIGLIAQCIRISHNPQTHHHALLLLIELFKVADIQSALHQVMQIFTFMGNSVLRQDDAYSIQIISKTIETIVPAISAINNEKNACELLRIFVTTLPDIPEHRRRPLFSKLLQLLQDYLHLYYMLSLNSHVKSSQVRNDQMVKTNSKFSEKLDFALQMAQEFKPQKIVEVSVQLVEFLYQLPDSLEEMSEAQKKKFRFNHVFDLKNCSSRDVRHIKYITIQFLTALLSAPEFINKIAEHESSEDMKKDYDQLIIKLVLLIGNTLKMAQQHNGSKFWRGMLHHEYEALDCVNNLLPNKMFLQTVKRLINHEVLVVRRKALEFLNARLHQKMFLEDDFDDLLELIHPLTQIICMDVKDANPDLEITQQTALIGLKFLAKLLAFNQQHYFIPVLELTTKLLKTREGPVLASAALCVAELCSSIGPYAVKSLNKFFPEILRLLDTHCCQETPDITVLSIVNALQKIIESVGNFISKDDVDQLLMKLCKLSSFYVAFEHPKVEMVMTRIKATAQKLSSNTPLRILLPSINRTYDLIVKKKDVKYISPLMDILAESFQAIQSSDLSSFVFNSKEQDLTSLFLKVFEFREQVLKDDEHITLKDIISVEESSSKALVSLVLKLSETTFRPLYYKFYDWAARNPNKKNRNITFFRLSANIAECLKSLFVLFAGHFVKHAAELLAENHISQKEHMIQNDELDQSDDAYRIELTEAILSTLMRTFEHDAHDFVNQERFDTLMKHLVDQLENTLGSVEDYEKRARELIVPCIAAFANAISDDSLQNQLVYHVILKANHEKVYVRIAVLNTLVEIARKLGKDFTPLLSEIIPVLMEMQEDEEMEKNVHSAIWALEEILEQPLQKYL